ncbi:DUF5606 domain-containing protein [Pontibacter silvestris]|uniref:DUF5606 domain-containing protein n=1 Tax=Pontibacter silvestris TaxID=2305183 RepID=A0ABW4WZT5_9BACT|nr:DUF5606 domain-containing protein [Pontibacter silvestris]MCC9135554.1 DUF5606 domain-containing protein [Pontibacter silvestris]
MPIDLRQVAAISGQSGLYRVVKPTRTGVIVESLEENPKNMVAQARHRMSLLEEISIYTTDEEATIPLADVFDRIHQKYGDDLPLSEKPSNEDYKAFIAEVVPEYDEDRVYVSDMKKLAAWYTIVNKFVGFTEEKASEEDTTPAESETEEGSEEQA